MYLTCWILHSPAKIWELNWTLNRFTNQPKCTRQILPDLDIDYHQTSCLQLLHASTLAPDWRLTAANIGGLDTQCIFNSFARFYAQSSLCNGRKSLSR